MEQDIDKRGVGKVFTKYYGEELCTLVSAYVHHKLPPAEVKELSELVQEAIIKTVVEWANR